MSLMLHILNGDTTLNLIKESSVKGTFLVWKDMLMEGPVSPTKIDWKARAEFLNRNYGIDSRKYLAAMKDCHAALDKAAKGKDEVVLWFEEDFFCQIHLVYLLATLPEPLKRKGRASIICPEKPLGVRLPGAFPKLLAGRIPIEPALLTLAKKVWAAYSASSSKGWESFLKWAQSGKGFEPWPLLKSGLRSHLGRLPTPNGKPNALETALLRSASAGNAHFPQFLRRVWSEPLVRPLGLGDLQVARYALDLSRKGKPLLTIEGPDNAPKPGQSFRYQEWILHLTAEGKARLAEVTEAHVVAPAASRGAGDTRGKPKSKSKSKAVAKAAFPAKAPSKAKPDPKAKVKAKPVRPGKASVSVKPGKTGRPKSPARG
ncbi:MAG: sigma-70 family polymerase sigma factor [Fibrobacteres bacterium]|nr:sigma-70 family polymerase sigma factor [Fibrobacterota bacterium]